MERVDNVERVMYKRFIVFNWPDFDPSPPFDCIMDSFEDEPTASCFYFDAIEKDKRCGPPESNFCIFDCDERKIINRYDGNPNSRLRELCGK